MVYHRKYQDTILVFKINEIKKTLKLAIHMNPLIIRDLHFL